MRNGMTFFLIWKMLMQNRLSLYLDRKMLMRNSILGISVGAYCIRPLSMSPKGTCDQKSRYMWGVFNTPLPWRTKRSISKINLRLCEIVWPLFWSEKCSCRIDYSSIWIKKWLWEMARPFSWSEKWLCRIDYPSIWIEKWSCEMAYWGFL